MSPENTKGRLAGSWAMRKRCQREAPSVRSRSSSSGSAAFNPSTVLTTMGKKQTSAITITFGRRSNPVQTTMMGAMAGMGSVWETTSQG